MVSTCNTCQRNFTTQRGLNIHRAHCNINAQEVIRCNNCFIDTNLAFQHHISQIDTSVLVNLDEINTERMDDSFEPDIPSFKCS